MNKWKWAACIDISLYQTVDELIELCHYAKIQALEANWRFTEGKTEKEIFELGEKFRKQGIEIYSFHLPFTQDDDISNFYETKRKQAIQRLIPVIEQSAVLGAKAVVLHPTTNHLDVKTEGFERYLSQMSKSIKEILPVAEKTNIIVCIENMLPGAERGGFGSKIEHFAVFEKEFVCKNLGFCFDTGHAFISYGNNGPVLFFEAIKKSIKLFHIQDNPGDRDLHIPPGRGLINWQDFFRKMAELRISFPATIEAVPFAPAQANKYTEEAWKKMFEDVNLVVEKALA